MTMRDLTRGYVPGERTDYDDGIAVQSFHHRDGRTKWFVFDSNEGWSSYGYVGTVNFYWGEARSKGWARRMFLNTHRASWHARRIAHRR